MTALRRWIALAAGAVGLAGALVPVWGKPAPASAGRRLALLVGVNAFDHKADAPHPDLQYAEGDAIALAALLRERGYAQGDTVVLTGAQPAASPLRATAANIRAQLMKIAGRTRPADTLVVYFSGNELQPTGSDEYYLCPADARKQDPRTMVGLTEAYTLLKQAKARSKLVLIDSCRSAEGAKTPALAPRQPPTGVAVLFACTGGGFAVEGGRWRHGLFTFVLLEGLRGAADTNKDGVTFVSEMEAYLKATVPAEARAAKVRGDQLPERIGQTLDTPLAITVGGH